MRARVREGYDGARVPHHREYKILILVHDRLDEELFQMLLQRQVDDHIQRILARFLRDLSDRTVRWKRLVEYEEPVKLGWARLRPDGMMTLLHMLARSLNQFAAALRIPQHGLLFGERELAHIAPKRRHVERHRTFERQQRADPAAGALHEHLAARRDGLIRQLVKGAPHRRNSARVDASKGGRHPGFERERLEPGVKVTQQFRTAINVFLGDLEHAGAQVAQYANELPDLVPICEPAGDRAAVGRLMVAIS